MTEKRAKKIVEFADRQLATCIQERDELKATAEAFEFVATEAEGRCVDLQKELDAYRKRIKELEKELDEYGDHLLNCLTQTGASWRAPQECSCGFSAALEKTRKP